MATHVEVNTGVLPSAETNAVIAFNRSVRNSTKARLTRLSSNVQHLSDQVAGGHDREPQCQGGHHEAPRDAPTGLCGAGRDGAWSWS